MTPRQEPKIPLNSPLLSGTREGWTTFKKAYPDLITQLRARLIIKLLYCDRYYGEDPVSSQDQDAFTGYQIVCGILQRRGTNGYERGSATQETDLEVYQEAALPHMTADEENPEKRLSKCLSVADHAEGILDFLQQRQGMEYCGNHKLGLFDATQPGISNLACKCNKCNGFSLYIGSAVRMRSFGLHSPLTSTLSVIPGISAPTSFAPLEDLAGLESGSSQPRPPEASAPTLLPASPRPGPYEARLARQQNQDASSWCCIM